MVTRIGPRNARPRRVFFREWREHRGLTQEQLADRLETTKATVSRMENSKSNYNRGYLEALADALDCEPFELLRSPHRPSIDDLLLKAPETDRARVISMIEAYLKTGTDG